MKKKIFLVAAARSIVNITDTIKNHSYGQETCIGDRRNIHLYAQLEIAVENDHFDDGLG